ncbi:MAG: DUF370 domain-containing protein [Clostridiales bacterium]|nr:DUF370 domain-containing protein [Clostridiales bacterium]
MFLHLGGDYVIKTKQIIAILDMESTLKSKDSRNFINNFIEKGLIEDIFDNDEHEPRSLVLVEDFDGKDKKNKIIKIYRSPISSTTLQKRADFIENFL